jgi:hypothetical protein
MKINFHFPAQTFALDITPLDNPAVQSWMDHFLTDDMHSRGFLATEWQSYDLHSDRVDALLHQARDMVTRLADHGYTYTGPFPESSTSINRFFTNDLHRFFTHSQRVVHDMTVEQRDLQNLLTDYLMKVNDCVHAIERYLTPAVPKWPLIDINIYQCFTYDAPGWWRMAKEWRQYHSAQHHDVILGPEILGKTVLKSFIDGDNPNDWDTTGHFTNHGSMVIQIGSTTRQDLYNSVEFNQWLEKWGMTYHDAWFDFPLGDITDRSQIESLHALMKGDSDDTGPEFDVTVTKN